MADRAPKQLTMGESVTDRIEREYAEEFGGLTKQGSPRLAPPALRPWAGKASKSYGYGLGGKGANGYGRTQAQVRPAMTDKLPPPAPPLFKNTSETSPITVDWFPRETTGTAGQLGMTLCPGRVQVSLSGDYKRSLLPDLQRLKDHHAVDILVCTIEEHEFKAQKIDGYFAECKKLGIEVIWLPIVDHGAPESVMYARKAVLAIIEAIRYGKNVVIHCRAGIGRTGCVAACCLVQLGYNPTHAIAVTRKTRARTLERVCQEEFVATYAGKGVKYADGDYRKAVQPKPKSDLKPWEKP